MSDTTRELRPPADAGAVLPVPALSIRGLYKDYDHGAVRALAGVDLTVARGEWISVTGPSGCGKSTLVHVIASLEVPTAGSVQVFGEDVATHQAVARFRRTQIGLIFQLHNLLPQLSAQQNVEIAMFGVIPDRHARAARARELLAAVDLAGRETRRPARLSGGERQRVAIARALANDPPLLLADEPTGNLDSASVDRVIELVRRLRQERPELTVVLVTHDARVAAAADRIVRMHDGRIVDRD